MSASNTSRNLGEIMECSDLLRCVKRRTCAFNQAVRSGEESLLWKSIKRPQGNISFVPNIRTPQEVLPVMSELVQALCGFIACKTVCGSLNPGVGSVGARKQACVTEDGADSHSFANMPCPGIGDAEMKTNESDERSRDELLAFNNPC